MCVVMGLLFQQGYLNDQVEIKTLNDDRYYTLNEYKIACNGVLPFNMPIVSMRAMLSAREALSANNPMMVPMVPMMPQQQPYYNSPATGARLFNDGGSLSLGLVFGC